MSAHALQENCRTASPDGKKVPHVFETYGTFYALFRQKVLYYFFKRKKNQTGSLPQWLKYKIITMK